MSQPDPGDWIASRFGNVSPEFTWAAGVGADWSKRLRSRLAEATGFERLRQAPLESEIGPAVNSNGLVYRRVSFASQPGLRVVGEIVVAEKVNSILPGVICLPGHGEGLEATLVEDTDDYQHAFPLQFARAGFAVLVVEQFSFGHRQTRPSPDQPYSCVRDSMAALSLGETMVAWRCLDALAGRDFLAALPEVDPSKIVTAGISGGGATAFWSACLDTQLAGCVVSGYFNTFADSTYSIDHCVDNFVPGLANIVEMPDMAALVAPRLLFVESGKDDPIFPRSAFDKACEIARAIYTTTSENFASHLFDGDHQWNGGQAVPWMAEKLKSLQM